MAVIEIEHLSGRKVRLHYDFGENGAAIIAQQYIQLFWDEIRDARIVPGKVFVDDSDGFNRSLSEMALPKNELIELLNIHDFVQARVAEELKITPRRLAYYIDKYQLNEYCQQMRNKLGVRKTVKLI